MNADKEHAQQLLDHLAPDQIAAVVHLMEVMLDPASRRLANAPPEDEEIGEEEERAVAESREWLTRNGGKGIPHAEAMRKLKLE